MKKEVQNNGALLRPREDKESRLETGWEKVLAGEPYHAFVLIGSREFFSNDQFQDRSSDRNPPEAPNVYNQGISVTRDLPQAPSRYAISYGEAWGLVELEVETSLRGIMERILPVMDTS